MSPTPRTPTIVGYQDLSLIGSGGFSQVYLANQSMLKRRVAIKVLSFGLDDDGKRHAFERETELMARVSMHPNIATIHDAAFTDEGQPCIVMGYYEGGSIADLIGRVGPLSVKETIDVGIAIASALDASHGAGIVHCDIKPQNILISSYGQPALGDFGISTFADERTQTGGSGSGFTLTYAAPEVLDGESPSVATDIYSLAATLYTSLAGHRPFAQPEDGGGKVVASEQARRILLDELAPLSQVPPVLDAAIRSAMDRDPDGRPASAAQFASQLYEIGLALGLPVSVPNTSDRAALRAPERPDATSAPIAPAIDPTRLMIKDAVSTPNTLLTQEPPARPESARLTRRVPLLVLAALVLAVSVGAFVILRSTSDSAIVGPSTLEAGTTVVYSVPSAEPGTIRWVDWNDEMVIQDELELTGVLPGVVRFSAVVEGETHDRQVIVEPSAQGPTIDGPTSLRVGEMATYTATAPGGAKLIWTSSTGASDIGATFSVTQVPDGLVVQVIATSSDGTERGNQVRVEADS